MQHPFNNPHHDNLDRKLSVHEYSDKICGAINRRTGKPEYCDFDCPTLHGKAPMPEPHWITDEARVEARKRELLEAALQPSTTLETGVAPGATLPAGIIS
jgi:hypothetical protein